MNEFVSKSNSQLIGDFISSRGVEWTLRGNSYAGILLSPLGEYIGVFTWDGAAWKFHILNPPECLSRSWLSQYRKVIDEHCHEFNLAELLPNSSIREAIEFAEAILQESYEDNRALCQVARGEHRAGADI